MIGIQQARPPFVEFKQVAKHDPKRSEELGYRVTKNVDMAFIMQPGSRDQVEIEAKAWLESIKRKSLNAAPDAYPQEWIDQFNKKFDAWKAGLELPEIGTSVREWPILSPAQVENLIAIKVMTIEDVAAMTEEAMRQFGMGGRELKTKAAEWIAGKDVAQNALQENEELKKQLQELAAKVAELEAEKPRRGRPPLKEVA